MMLLRSAALFAATLGACASQPNQTSGVVSSEVEPVIASRAPSRVADLSWMAGDWIGEQGGGTVEEHWTPPAGGMMLGTGRVIAEGRTLFFEYMRIEENATGVVFIALPRGKVEVAFQAIEGAPGLVVFENLTHDSPVRVSYRMNDQGQLIARTEGPEGDARDFPMTRVSPPAIARAPSDTARE
jgi:hypothetical protein